MQLNPILSFSYSENSSTNNKQAIVIKAKNYLNDSCKKSLFIDLLANKLKEHDQNNESSHQNYQQQASNSQLHSNQSLSSVNDSSQQFQSKSISPKVKDNTKTTQLVPH